MGSVSVPPGGGRPQFGRRAPQLNATTTSTSFSGDAPALVFDEPAPPDEMEGPTPWSNWVVKGRVLAGGYPCALNDVANDKLLNMLLHTIGIDTFVCLQNEVNLNVPESLWRAGRAPRPYIHDARRLLQEGKRRGTVPLERKVDFLHLPIPDGGVTTDNAISTLANDCIARVKQGERLYIHCWGGHGRTGTLIAIMLARMYGIHAQLSLLITQAYHDSRQFPQNMGSPSTSVQRQQVLRILEQKSRLGPSPSQASRSRQTHKPPNQKRASGNKNLGKEDEDVLSRLKMERPRYKLTPKEKPRRMSPRREEYNASRGGRGGGCENHPVPAEGTAVRYMWQEGTSTTVSEGALKDESGGREKRRALAAAALRPHGQMRSKQ